MSFSIVQNQSVPSARNVTASGANLAALTNVTSAKGIVVGLQAEVDIVYAIGAVITPTLLAAAVGLPSGVSYVGFGYFIESGALVKIGFVGTTTPFVITAAAAGVAKISLFT